MKKSFVIVLAVAVLIASLASFVTQMLIIFDAGQQITAKATTGQIDFCINAAPQLTVPCNTSLSQNTSFACQVNATDLDGHNVTISRIFNSTNEIFNVTPNGSINFTPTNEDVGDYIVTFIGVDTSGCSNNASNTTFNITVANINDPPFLAQTIPDQTLASNTTLSAFFLVDYFQDPDGDPLNFTSSLPVGVTVTILPSSEVRFSSNACFPSGVLVTFTAEDPFNETAESNPVTVIVTCDAAAPGGSGSGGGGGGGGGGAALICESDWVCEEWFDCLPAGEQWRRCYDQVGCKEDKYLQRSCDYTGGKIDCSENWLCSEWGVCHQNQTQYRTCEDLNACGSDVVKPSLEQACVYIATCTDGIQNGNETGVDCGGRCPKCALLEQPLPFIGDVGLKTWMLVLLIIGILLVSGVVRYYKAELAQLIATAGFLLKHRVVKDVLLSAEGRRSLFERITRFERSLRKKDFNPVQVYDNLGMLVREYTHEALGVAIESVPEEVAARCEQLGLQKETTQLVNGLFGKLEVIEQQELEYDPFFVIATLEEVRSLVCLTSQYEHEEILRPLEEIPVSNDMSFYDEIFVRVTNVLRAVQFDQIDLAKKEYVKLLSRYDPLSEKEKEQIYPELLWAFHATKFQTEVTGSKVVKKPVIT